MRRLNMKGKRGKSETSSDNESEENGGIGRGTSIANYNDEMKKGKDNEHNDNTPRKSATKKRLSRNRTSMKNIAEDSPASTDVDDANVTDTDTEEENKNVGRAGPSKRLKKDEQKLSPLIAREGNNKKEYEVEKIINQRTIKGRRQFLVRWKGYGEDEDTWEQEKDLNCLELIEDYLAEDAENEESNKSKKSENSPRAAKNKNLKDDKKIKKTKNNSKRQSENDKQIMSDEEKRDKEDQKEYEVERIIEVHFKKNKKREFLIRWKGFTSADDTWEPEENLNCPDLIAKFMQKVEEAKSSVARELRANRPHTKRYTLTTHDAGRRLSRRNMDKQRATYHECDE